MKQTSLDALNAQLMETIEMLKNNTCSKASKNEKIDVETAKAIANIGKVMVDGYRVKASVLGLIAKNDFMSKELTKAASTTGIIVIDEFKAIDK